MWGWTALPVKVSPHFHVSGPRASGKGTIAGFRGDWACCNSGQKPEKEVGRPWGWGVRKVRDSRNSMETSNVSRGRSKTVVGLGKVQWGACGPGGGTIGAPRSGFGHLGVAHVFSTTTSPARGTAQRQGRVHQQRGAHAWHQPPLDTLSA